MVEDLKAAAAIGGSIWRMRIHRPVELGLTMLVNSLDVVTPTLALVALTHTFGTLGGWGVGEVLMLVGSANACLGVAMFLMGAFDSFLFVPIYRSGQLHAALLRPGNTMIYLAASSLRPYRVGRILASFITIAIGWAMVGGHGLLALTLPVYIGIGAVMVSCFWVVDASSTVRAGQQNDLTRQMAFTSTEMSFFPHGLYPLSGRIIAQFVFGVGAAAYLPLSWVLGLGPNLGLWSLVVAPAIMPLMILIAREFWRRSIARLEVTGGP